MNIVENGGNEQDGRRRAEQRQRQQGQRRRQERVHGMKAREVQRMKTVWRVVNGMHAPEKSGRFVADPVIEAGQGVPDGQREEKLHRNGPVAGPYCRACVESRQREQLDGERPDNGLGGRDDGRCTAQVESPDPCPARHSIDGRKARCAPVRR